MVAAGTLLSELDLQALDHTVLLLQLFGQPDDGDEEEEEDFTKKKGSRSGFLHAWSSVGLISENGTLLCWGTFYQSAPEANSFQRARQQFMICEDEKDGLFYFHFIFAVTGLILRNSQYVQSLL